MKQAQRRHELNEVLSSDIDLTKFASRRVQITKTPDGRFQFKSSLRFFACERSSFVNRYLRRKAPGRVAYSGVASRPDGYYWKADHLERAA